MTTDDLARMNTIVDKALKQTATVNELKEFNQLLTQWEELSGFDLAQLNSSHQREPKKYQ